MRRIEQQDADQRYEPSLRNEAAIRRRPVNKEAGLKKQSQYAPAKVGANTFVKGDYGNIPAFGWKLEVLHRESLAPEIPP